MNNQRQICALQNAATEVVSARAEAFDERQEVAAADGQGESGEWIYWLHIHNPSPSLGWDYLIVRCWDEQRHFYAPQNGPLADQ